MTVCGANLIATGGSDNTVRIWNWQTRDEAEHFVGHTGSVATLAFDPASGVLISGSYDTTVRVWRLEGTGGSQDTAGELDAGRRVR